MRNLTKLLCMLCCFSLSMTALAQEKNQEREDSYYLTGAVPETDGKVVFTKEYYIPGMSQEEIFNRVEKWMSNRLKENKNNSRVVFTDKEKGMIVGLGEEWLVFRSTALSLDRSIIKYQLTATCQPEKCLLNMEKIRFEYRDGEEKYTAEEWIVDKYALNKSKTKMVRGLAKWRIKTVDFNDKLAQELTAALSANQIEQEKAKEDTKVQNTSGPIYVTPQKEVTVNNAVVSVTSPTVAVPMATLTPAQPATSVKAETSAAPATPNYKEIAPEQLSSNLIQMGSGKLVLFIGTDEFNMTVMTANAGGTLGKIADKPVIFSMLSPDQPYEAMENADAYTVKFFPHGEKTPSVILDCKKLPSQKPLEGQPRMYVGEIIKAKVK